MDTIPFLLLAAATLATGYDLGRRSKESPSEQEMLRRIIQARVGRRLQDEITATVTTEVHAEISREVARS